jgi:hypothetical protein
MFTITHQANGLARTLAKNVPAYAHANMWRIPNFASLAPNLSAKLASALQRSSWDQCASDVLRADLTDRNGKPIGTIFAKWEA